MERFISHDEIFEMQKRNRQEIDFAHRVNAEVQEFGYFKSAKNDNVRMLYEMLYSYGQFVQYPYGVVAKQMQLSNYYRGERAYYGSSKATLHRNVPKDKIERLVYYFIENMRIGEFSVFLRKLDIIKNWKTSSINYDALAQHYGLKTDYVDITNDFNVALFFACCKYNTISKKWEPLSKEDIQLKENGSIDYRYGVLYRGESLSKDFLYRFGNQNPYNPVRPIGFQPLMRCHFQHAYTMQMNEDDDLYRDPRFEILKFEHSLELSDRIFQEMKQGEYIYPRYEIRLLDDCIERVKNTRIFSQQVFENVFSWLFTFPYLKDYDTFSINEIRDLLIERNIEIKDGYSVIDDKMVGDINEKCSEEMNFAESV